MFAPDIYSSSNFSSGWKDNISKLSLIETKMEIRFLGIFYIPHWPRPVLNLSSENILTAQFFLTFGNLLIMIVIKFIFVFSHCIASIFNQRPFYSLKRDVIYFFRNVARKAKRKWIKTAQCTMRDYIKVKKKYSYANTLNCLMFILMR